LIAHGLIRSANLQRGEQIGGFILGERSANEVGRDARLERRLNGKALIE
jgi:hypothetical protein